jgi:hypothetical protein
MTVRGSCKVWLGFPDESATVRPMLYALGAAVLGTLSVAVTVTGVFALIAIGLVGAIVHCAPGMALVSQVALTEPL